MMRYVVLILGTALEMLWAMYVIRDFRQHKKDKSIGKYTNFPESTASFLVLHAIFLVFFFILACVIWW